MQEELSRLFQEASQELKVAVEEKQVAEIKTSFLGRKGKITTLLRGLGEVPPDQRPIVGRLANEI